MSNKVATAQPDPFLTMVGKLAESPEIDADKVQKFLDMQMAIMDRTAKTDFYAAMTAVQAKLPRVVQNCNNQQTSSRYANHEALAAAIKPIYTAEGFSMSFSEGQSDKEGYLRINGLLRHSAGYSEPSYVDIPLDDAGIRGSVNKTKTHATGSTFSYGRRYLTLLVFDVATGDDTDGNLPAALVTEEQADQLRAKFDLLPKTTQSAFLKWALSKPELDGEESVDDLGAKYFDDYMKNLDKKLAKTNESA